MSVLLVTPDGLGSEKVLPAVRAVCQAAGVDLVVVGSGNVTQFAAERAGWSGELRTDEINTLTVVDGRIVAVK